jgi:hypothetical protein
MHKIVTGANFLLFKLGLKFSSKHPKRAHGAAELESQKAFAKFIFHVVSITFAMPKLKPSGLHQQIKLSLFFIILFQSKLFSLFILIFLFKLLLFFLIFHFFL